MLASRIIFKSEKGKEIAAKAMKWAGKTLKFATKLLPFASEVMDIAGGLAAIFTEQPDYKNEFMEKVLEKARVERIESQIIGIEAFLKTVQEHVPFINETTFCVRDKYEKQHQNLSQIPIQPQLLDQYLYTCNGSGVDVRTNIIHYKFIENVNEITMMNSSYRHYPLLAAPVLIELGLMASLFEPFAMEFIFGVANDRKISCKYRDAMIDHLPFVLEARFQKVKTDVANMVKVRNEPYNPNGYLQSEDPHLPCLTNCDNDDCLVDEFGTREFMRSDFNHHKDKCEIGYLRYLRHLVEKLFPIDILDQACGRPLGKPSGNSSISSKKYRSNF